MNTNAYPKKRNKRKRISTPIPKEQSNTIEYVEDMTNLEQQEKDTISEPMLEKIKSEEIVYEKLVENFTILSANERAHQAITLKYLELKEKVLETEEELLKLGVKTSTLPAFCLNEEDRTPPDIEVIEDPRREKLLKLEITREDKIREEIFQKFNVYT
ncbi:uncharacterized protein LOC100575025 [Acyrthosiphon pisum]|uniref:Uncharacterized protein n=1 Tax=Acyrthosiphon pisum TaxID=7029 RepID=A0A8R2B1F2_ACYPI|nr:uncharacterized protein LOC100575025 [Acyrthosiphon pisum]|eukprot:XP_008179725.1 PREDICTED: uncharacterized protein LOC100575025 [Acyrthosiphon pisum]